MSSPARRVLLAVLAGGLLVPGLALPAAGGAYAAILPASAVSSAAVSSAALPGASPALGSAQARATDLRHRVDALRLAAEQATEAYDQADEELGRTVTEHLSAQAQLDQASNDSQARSDDAARRVRALYTSGGLPGLYASVLDSGDPGEALSRMQAVRSLVEQDRLADGRGGAAVASRAAVAGHAAELADRQTRLQRTAAARADRVRALLAQTDALLAGADRQVRTLADQQRRQQEAAAARQAAARFAAASRVPNLGTLPAGSPAGTAPTTSAVAATALAAARSHLGAPYVWGATGPDSFDCSGLTQAAYRAAGVALPRTSQEQWYAGPHVALADLAPGDLLFWASNPADPGSIHHVALYAGDGQMIAAPHTGTVVRIQPVYLDGYLGAVRPTAAG